MRSRRLLVIAALALVAGCQSETPLGQCVGLNGRATRDSTLVYEYSARNIVLGIVFAELIVPPVVVALKQLECPVARKPRAGGSRG
jgi:hypothetical protein